MDLADFIAAGPKIAVEVGSRARLQAQLGELRHRSFLSDFVEGAVVASMPIGRVVISRSLSWNGQYGMRFIGRVSGPETNLKLQGRVWHSPFSTVHLVLLYVMVLLVLIAGLGAILQRPAEILSIFLMMILFGGSAFLMGVVTNAVSRAMRATAIEELTKAVRNLARST